MHTDIRNHIIRGIHAMDRQYLGALSVAKVAKTLNVDVEQVAQVVEEMISRGDYFRHPAQTKDEFTVRVRE